MTISLTFFVGFITVRKLKHIIVTGGGFWYAESFVSLSMSISFGSSTIISVLHQEIYTEDERYD